MKKICLALGLLVLSVLLIGCGGNSDKTELQEVKDKMAALGESINSFYGEMETSVVVKDEIMETPNMTFWYKNGHTRTEGVQDGRRPLWVYSAT